MVKLEYEEHFEEFILTVKFNIPTCFRCGYLKVPRRLGFTLAQLEDLEVHGGVTWSSESDPDYLEIGFDCAHYNDIPDIDYAEKFIEDIESYNLESAKVLKSFCTSAGSKVWQLDDVVEELVGLIEQVRKL